MALYVEFMQRYLLKIAVVIISLVSVFGCSNKYDPMVLKSINLNIEGFQKEFTFTNRYRGNYNLGLYVDKPVFHLDQYETNFEIEITIFQHNNQVITEKVSNPVFNFNGWEKGKGGLALLIYNSPKDLPLNNALDCRIKVLKPDLSFEEKYGRPKFYIRKMSDK